MSHPWMNTELRNAVTDMIKKENRKGEYLTDVINS